MELRALALVYGHRPGGFTVGQARGCNETHATIDGGKGNSQLVAGRLFDTDTDIAIEQAQVPVVVLQHHGLAGIPARRAETEMLVQMLFNTLIELLDTKRASTGGGERPKAGKGRQQGSSLDTVHGRLHQRLVVLAQDIVNGVTARR